MADAQNIAAQDEGGNPTLGRKVFFLSPSYALTEVIASGGLPEKIETILNDKERIQWFASKHAADSDMFFIGRGIDYAVSMEGSLKMKEISYIWAFSRNDTAWNPFSRHSTAHS